MTGRYHFQRLRFGTPRGCQKTRPSKRTKIEEVMPFGVHCKLTGCCCTSCADLRTDFFGWTRFLRDSYRSTDYENVWFVYVYTNSRSAICIFVWSIFKSIFTVSADRKIETTGSRTPALRATYVPLSYCHL